MKRMLVRPSLCLFLLAWTAPCGAILVSSNLDSGANTLRAAILSANGTVGADTITFGIGTGAQTITLLTDLPQITQPLTIDGTSQPGFAGTPLIRLAKGGTATTGLDALTTNVTIKGLVITGFPTAGIVIKNAPDFSVTGCYVGTTGAAASPNGIGIKIINPLISGTATTIGGLTAAARNVISGNTGDGISVVFDAAPTITTAPVILGNFIGVNAAGTAALPNGGAGIHTNIVNIEVGSSSSSGGRNVISGNTGDGILADDDSGSIFVFGNSIGTNLAGTSAIPNGGAGIHANAGGLVDGRQQANFISGNTGPGIKLEFTGLAVKGNRIGTNATGTAALPNAGGGVLIEGGANNIVGGSAVGDGNLISGNTGDGVRIHGVGPNVSANLIGGNLIGTKADGVGALGNTGHGVSVDSSTAQQVGGSFAAPNANGNVIANNTLDGVSVQSGIGHVVLGNSIFANGGTPIDLGNDGPTANDVCDADVGANDLQNSPEITYVESTATSLRVKGNLSSPAGTYLVQVFASDSCARAVTPLGSTTVVVSACAAQTPTAFTTQELAWNEALGTAITLTATKQASGTSEVSGCVFPIPALRGDADNDGTWGVSDVFFLINALFAGGPQPFFACLGDASNSNGVTVEDVFYLINFLFAGGPVPNPPLC